jgi:tRNA (pseudouridine54-N1)-methyltransferase
VRAGLLVSHGLRPEVRVYLVLRGGPAAPRVLRVDGNSARFLRPDERSLALLVQKTLAAAPVELGSDFIELRPGIALARGDLECVLSDLRGATLYVLDERGPDVRDIELAPGDAAYLLGDHVGFDAADSAKLAALAVTAVSLGPLSVHSDDAVVILSNELDRRAARPG